MGVFTSPETLQIFLRGAGLWAPLIFVGIQVVQVVFPIIPGGLTCVAGVLLFGPAWGFLYNYVGICIGSCINFSLAKQYGRPFVERSVSEKMWGKYIKWLDSPKFDLYFALAIFFPVAPDDFLCLLAGLTPMKFRRFRHDYSAGETPFLLAYSWGLATALSWLAQFLGAVAFPFAVRPGFFRFFPDFLWQIFTSHTGRKGGQVMTEREKMLSGQLYDPSDEELVRLRRRAFRLVVAVQPAAEGRTPPTNGRFCSRCWAGIGGKRDLSGGDAVSTTAATPILGTIATLTSTRYFSTVPLSISVPT